MTYTVRHNGTPIGTTELGFIRTDIDPPFRMGWFIPNEEGKQVIARCMASVWALRAFAGGPTLDEHGFAVEQPDLPEDVRAADLAEAQQRESEMQLTLHREDGSLVPTEGIDFRDYVEMQRIFPDPEDEEEPDAELQAAIDHDLAIIEGWWAEREETDEAREWSPDTEEVPETMRYQIRLHLVNAADIP